MTSFRLMIAVGALAFSLILGAVSGVLLASRVVRSCTPLDWAAKNAEDRLLTAGLLICRYRVYPGEYLVLT